MKSHFRVKNRKFQIWARRSFSDTISQQIEWGLESTESVFRPQNWPIVVSGIEVWGWREIRPPFYCIISSQIDRWWSRNTKMMLRPRIGLMMGHKMGKFWFQIIFHSRGYFWLQWNEKSIGGNLRSPKFFLVVLQVAFLLKMGKFLFWIKGHLDGLGY